MEREEIIQLLRDEFGLQPPRSGEKGPTIFGENVEIGSNVKFGRGVVLYDNVELGDGVQVGNRVTLRNCILGDGVRIEDNCTIGYETLTGGFSHKLEGHTKREPIVIGENSLIRTDCVLYQSVTIGSNSWINHGVLLREHTHIGNHTCIGSLSDSEGYNTIGDHVLIHSQVHLCARLTIEDYVFIAPFTVFTNGNPMNYAREIESEEAGPSVRFGVQIAVNVVVLPRVEIGYEALIGASAVVTKDVPSLGIVLGVPGKVVGQVPDELRMPEQLRRKYYQGNLDPRD